MDGEIETAAPPLSVSILLEDDIDVSRGDIIVFVDADCVVHTDTLSRIVQLFERDPDLGAAFGSYDDKPPAELRESTGDFLRRMGVDHPTYHDPGAATLLALHAIGVDDAFPTTIVVDRQGTIRGVWRGYHYSAIAEIEQLLKELLATAE